METAKSSRLRGDGRLKENGLVRNNSSVANSIPASPSCHSTSPPASPSCHSPNIGTSQHDGLKLLVGGIFTVITWVSWLLPNSSPLHQPWLMGALATAVIVITGWPILVSGWHSIPNRTPNMDTLISLGVVTAWVWSLWSLIADQAESNHFAMAAAIIIFVRFGGWLEGRSQKRSNEALTKLAEVSAKVAPTGRRHRHRR